VDIEHQPESSLRRALGLVTAFDRALRENEDRVFAVRRTTDLAEVGRDGRIGLILSLEGAEPLGLDPGLAGVFFELGVRMVGLTWNRRNAFADGAAESGRGGLSRLGHELVERLARLGVMVDLSHASEQTFADVLAHEAHPQVLVSHACCRAVHDTPRNVSDDQLRALADRDGVIGLMALPLAVDPERPTIERLVDHIDHAVSVAGIEHVALGGDFIEQVHAVVDPTNVPDSLLRPGASMGQPLEGLAGPADYPALIDALRARRFEGERLDAILAGNWLRLFRRALST
jgi:membrane dipeptidase